MHDVEFQICDAGHPRGREAWLHYWKQWPGREVFAHPDYLRLYGGPNVRVVCAAASNNGSYVLYPFLLRALGNEPYCDNSLRDYTDIASPYGYGGPFRWGSPWGPEATLAFWCRFDDWAAKSRIISEVVRLALFDDTLMEYPGERRVQSENIVRTIGNEGELWQDFEHKVRKNVNKARANGVSIQIEERGDFLDAFLNLYTGTMDRRQAGATYYFPRGYFERIHADLKGQFAYFHALVAGAIVSTELVLVSADRVYSFLGGTDAAWFHVRPNDLLKLEIMNWARDAGKKEFVLGGGYAPEDGIYRYKRSFAPDGSVPFSIGSRIFCPHKYEQLIHSRRALAVVQGSDWQPNTKYFPAYRS